MLKNRYYLMRHGESLANLADKIVSSPEHGCTGYGLSPLGFEQARTQAERSGLGAETRVICSDFLRTGRWEGSSAANYEPVWRRDQADEGGDEVESARQLTERLVAVLEELEAAHSGQCFLLVSHGDPLRFLQLWALARPTREHQSIRHFAPAEIRALQDAPGPSLA